MASMTKIPTTKMEMFIGLGIIHSLIEMAERLCWVESPLVKQKHDFSFWCMKHDSRETTADGTVGNLSKQEGEFPQQVAQPMAEGSQGPFQALRLRPVDGVLGLSPGTLQHRVRVPTFRQPLHHAQ